MAWAVERPDTSAAWASCQLARLASFASFEPAAALEALAAWVVVPFEIVGLELVARQRTADEDDRPVAVGSVMPKIFRLRSRVVRLSNLS